MEFTLRSKTARRLTALLELAGLLALSLQVVRMAAAEHFATKPLMTIPDMERAVRLDPSSARYHLFLGNLLRYSLDRIDLPRAMQQLQRAAELEPYAPQPWLDLGSALEFQGRISEAETCLARANMLAPNLTKYQWVIGNFYLLHGNVPLAFQSFRKVLAGTSKYDDLLFDTAWKASGDGDEILKDLIPQRISTEYSYLSYLISLHHLPEAQGVWERMASSPESFAPNLAATYMDSLIAGHRPDEAYQVWLDLRNRGLIPPTYQQTSQNLVLNGDFEDDLLNFGFDWRTPPMPSVYVTADKTEFHSPSHSMLIQFTGKENVNFQTLNQYVLLQPKHEYQFRAFIKTEGITTDSGIRFAVRDAYDTARLDRRSDNYVGDTQGWMPVEFSFTTGPDTGLVNVCVIRPSSQKLDNLVAGKAWVDDVTISPVTRDLSHEHGR